MANPKFIPVESKVLINARLPKSLTEKLEKYSKITGNTKTDILTTALSEYFNDITLDNSYLTDISGITLNIPFVPEQKDYCINHKTDLTKIINNSKLANDSFFHESFEIIAIPNNLDEFDGETYKTDEIYYGPDDNINIIHSGIEFFIYPNLYDTLNRAGIHRYSVDNLLYCFYFALTEKNNLIINIIDPITAINYLTKSNNDALKNRLISCYKELEKICKVELERDEIISAKVDELDNYHNNPNAPLDLKVDRWEILESVETEIYADYNPKINDLINEVAEKFNTRNIIKLGDVIPNSKENDNKINKIN